MFGECEDQPWCRYHRACTIASNREYSSQRYHYRTDRAGERSSDIDKCCLVVVCCGNNRNKHENDEEVEHSGADDSAYQGARQYVSWF